MHLRNGKTYNFSTKTRYLVWECELNYLADPIYHCLPGHKGHDLCQFAFIRKNFKNRCKKGIVKLKESELSNTFIILPWRNQCARPKNSQKQFGLDWIVNTYFHNFALRSGHCQLLLLFYCCYFFLFLLYIIYCIDLF